jgi:sugar phosphate isomerase/epimerase
MSLPPRISVQLYSLRDECAADFTGGLRRLGAIGFAGVELAGFHDLTPQQFATVAADSGLAVSSAHVNYSTPEAFNAALDDLEVVGCDTAIVPFLPPDVFADLGSVHRSADALNVAAAIARSRGMRFGYHNHWWEFENRFDGRTAWSHLFDHLAPDVFAELDTYWCQVGGSDPTAVIADNADRVRILHMKDGPARDSKAAMVAVGHGAINVPAVVAASPSIGWHVVELDRCDTDMFEAVEASYRYLVGNGLSQGRK